MGKSCFFHQYRNRHLLLKIPVLQLKQRNLFLGWRLLFPPKKEINVCLLRKLYLGKTNKMLLVWLLLRRSFLWLSQHHAGSSPDFDSSTASAKQPLFAEAFVRFLQISTRERVHSAPHHHLRQLSYYIIFPWRTHHCENTQTRNILWNKRSFLLFYFLMVFLRRELTLPRNTYRQHLSQTTLLPFLRQWGMAWAPAPAAPVSPLLPSRTHIGLPHHCYYTGQVDASETESDRNL